VWVSRGVGVAEAFGFAEHERDAAEGAGALTEFAGRHAQPAR
jgi:hypothetical protein